jgi:D-tyrosyl-tRNA(Tyr) deacylase
MRILIQRVTSAWVEVKGERVAQISTGLLLLVGFGAGDTAHLLDKAVTKVANLRIFPDNTGRFQYSVSDIRGDVLAVPQFTLYGQTEKGRRPDFGAALSSPEARELFTKFVVCLGEKEELCVQSGVFGADMAVSLVNDGPVTLLLEIED